MADIPVGKVKLRIRESDKEAHSMSPRASVGDMHRNCDLRKTVPYAAELAALDSTLLVTFY